MKRFLILSILIVLLGTTMSAQTVTLTFTGRNTDNQYVQLNRVVVTNHSKNWQETIYWPDTILIMQESSGIGDYIQNEGRFVLSQNNPNPFESVTYANLILAETGDVVVEVTDIVGRIVETQNFASLRQGTHQLRITLSSSGVYFLSARQKGYISSIKMVKHGNGGANDISIIGDMETNGYTPIQSSLSKNAPKHTTNNPFTLGDQMEYVGFAIINGTEVESQHITQGQNASQTFTLQFFESGGTPQDGQPCPGAATITDYDGNVYNTVQIGNQCWMKENLRATHYANGTSITLGNSTSTTTGYYYYPDDNASNVSTYGFLYNWKAVMGSFSSSSANPSGVQGICPNGWHVPSDAEWTQLIDYVSSQSQYVCGNDNTYIAKALASTTGWESYSGDCVVGNEPSTNNSTGFSALPAGSHIIVNAGFGIASIFWNTSEYDNNYAYMKFINYGTAYVGEASYAKEYSLSLRCVRDGEGGGSETVPTVHTAAVSDITGMSATCGGNVTDDGGGIIIARGVCWNTSPNPTVSASHTTNGSGTGSFISNLTGLTSNTTYYVRAYATNSLGTAYGEQRNFTTTSSGGGEILPCPDATTVTDYDNNTYNTLQIGTQCWMKENLRTTHYANGVSIPLGSDTSNTTGYRYYPNNDQSNVAIYGYLYNWKALMGSSSSSNATPSGVQGICPNGWHVPSDTEWTQLIDYVSSQSQYVCGGNNTYIAKALASTTGWYSYPGTCVVGDDQSTNNATGFSALPAGLFVSGLYTPLSLTAGFCSATEYDDNYVNCRNITYGHAIVNHIAYTKSYGLSVRCVRD